MWILTTPLGFETYFARCAQLFAASPAPDMNGNIATGAEHGTHFDKAD